MRLIGGNRVCERIGDLALVDELSEIAGRKSFSGWIAILVGLWGIGEIPGPAAHLPAVFFPLVAAFFFAAAVLPVGVLREGSDSLTVPVSSALLFHAPGC